MDLLDVAALASHNKKHFVEHWVDFFYSTANIFEMQALCNCVHLTLAAQARGWRLKRGAPEPDENNPVRRRDTFVQDVLFQAMAGFRLLFQLESAYLFLTIMHKYFLEPDFIHRIMLYDSTIIAFITIMKFLFFLYVAVIIRKGEETYRVELEMVQFIDPTRIPFRCTPQRARQMFSSTFSGLFLMVGFECVKCSVFLVLTLFSVQKAMPQYLCAVFMSIICILISAMHKRAYTPNNWYDHIERPLDVTVGAG